MKKTSYMFATPCYGGLCNMHYANSCTALTELLVMHDINYAWLRRDKESLIHRARNGMAHEFLQSDFDVLWWIDADIQFSLSDFIDVDNMLTEGADVAVGVYRMKSDDSKYAAWVDGELVTDLDMWSGPKKVDYAGTGFMAIPRKTLQVVADTAEKYENEYPDIANIYPSGVIQAQDGKAILESEDYGFCRLVRESGLDIFMDPGVRLTHWGTKGYG